MRFQRSFAICWIICLFLIPSLARADGAFFPAGVGVATMPNMPSQRALIVHDGTTETLLIESTMNARQGSDFSWILPLPAEPFAIDKGSPGALSTIFMHFGPKLVTASEMGLGLSALGLFFSLCICGMILAVDQKSRERWYSLFAFVLIWCFLMSISVGTGPSSISAPAQLLSRETVGNYDVAVLRGTSAEPIAAWLAQNGFAPPNPKCRAAIDQYARENWVFLVAKLHRTGTGAMAPHPLQIRFPSAVPIYPMRLTAAVGQPVYLKLAVVAKRPWRHPKLKTEYAQEIEKWGSQIYAAYPGGVHLSRELNALIPAKCWLCVMDGTMDAAQMNEDIVFEPMTSITERPSYFTPRAAVASGLRTFIWILSLGFPVISVIFASKGRPQNGKRTALVLIMLAMVAGILTCRGSNTLAGARDIMLFDRSGSSQLINYRNRLHANLKITPQMTRDEVATNILEILKDKRNIFSDEPLRMECSPGNFELIPVPEEKGYVYIVWYNYNCHGMTVEKIQVSDASQK